MGAPGFLEFQSAAYLKRFACDPTGLRGGHKGHGFGDIFGCAEAAKRGAGDGVLLCRFVHLFHGIETFGDGDAGRYSDDADLLRAEFHGKHAGDDVDGGFGSGIDGARGSGSEGDSRADIDDDAAFGAEVGNGGLGGEQECLDVEVEVFVDVLSGDGFERKKFVDAGVVDEDVEAAKGFGRRGDELGDLGGIGQVGLHGNSLAGCGLNLLDKCLGGGGAAGVVDYHRGAVCGEALRNGRSYSFRGPGDECDFTLKIGHCSSYSRTNYADGLKGQEDV